MPIFESNRIRSLKSRITGRAGPATAQTRMPAETVAAPSRDPQDWLEIPVISTDLDQEAHDEAVALGSFLARQDRWDDLSERIRTAEAKGETTPGGAPLAELYALGARSDIVTAAKEALSDGASQDTRVLTDGVSDLEEVLEEFPDDYPVALTVALAHIDLGRAWTKSAGATATPESNPKSAGHFQRAKEILAPHCGIELGSPRIAAAHCALTALDPEAQDRLADDFEDLIDLDPKNHRSMQDLGLHLLTHSGGPDQLELEARRTAARMFDIWGAGGYAWVYSKAIVHNDDACAQLDVDYFVDGLADIIHTRPDQHMVNYLAAYCAMSLLQRSASNPKADRIRARLSECTRWLVRDKLTEVHPLIWSKAASGFDGQHIGAPASRTLVRGRLDALNIIRAQFADEIQNGHRVRYTANGPELLPA